MNSTAKIIEIRRGLNGWPYSACTESGQFITNAASLDEIRELYKVEIKSKRIKLRKELKLYPAGEIPHYRIYGYVAGKSDPVADLTAAGATSIYQDTIPGGSEWSRLSDNLRGGDTVVVSSLSDLALSVGQLWSVVSELVSRRVTVVINGIGTFDNMPQSEPLRILLSALADFDNGLPAAKVRAGKAEARKRPGYRDGRPPIDREKINAAMALLETHSYSETVKLTGISASTLARERRRRKTNQDM